MSGKSNPVLCGNILYPALYLLFFAYRSYYWENFLQQWPQISLNSAFDCLVVIIIMASLKRIRNYELLRKNNLILIAVIFVFIVAGSIVLKQLHYLGHFITVGFSPVFRVTFSKFSFQFFDSYVVLCIGTMIAYAALLHDKWAETSLRNECLEKEKALAELKYLRAQVNPHLLFNTLNNLYFLIDESNKEARKSLEAFCHMLRYQLYESNATEVEINKEVAYLTNYISLQKLRLSPAYRVHFSVSDQLGSFTIAPMLLLTLVENAFKHLRIDPENENSVSIEMSRNENLFSFIVRNSCNPGENPHPGIGLNNLRQRLNLLYDKRSNINIIHTNDTFTAVLTLQI